MQQILLKNGKNLTIGTKLKEIRERLKITQDELSKMLGISKSLISRIELGGIESMQHTTIIRLVEQLNISLQWLLFDEGEMIAPTIDISSLIAKEEEYKALIAEKDDEIQRLRKQVDILIKAVGITK